MTIQKYINKNKELHSALLAFLENAEDAENGCRELIHIIKTKKYEKNQNEFEHFLPCSTTCPATPFKTATGSMW